MNTISSTARGKVRAAFFCSMGRFRVIGPISLVILALALASCAPPASTGPTTAPVATTAPQATTAPTATIAPVATTAPAATEGPAAAAAAMVMAAKNASHVHLLADREGRTLNLFNKDSKNTTTCYDQCAQNWPPLLTSGAAKAGDGADSAMLGTTARNDGTLQITYNGWPLYYYAKDQKAGDTTGQDVGSVWFVVSPKGDKLKAAKVIFTKNDKLGSILTDDEGKTLYLFTPDSKNTTTCYDACAQAWPPLLTAGAPEASDGADASLLGTTVRADGATQVTYNDAPVYYFAKDQKAGDTTGQGVGDVWFVLSAEGNRVAASQ